MIGSSCSWGGKPRHTVYLFSATTGVVDMVVMLSSYVAYWSCGWSAVAQTDYGVSRDSSSWKHVASFGFIFGTDEGEG